MNKLILKTLVFIYLFSLYACSTTGDSKLFVPVKTQLNKATLYIYRPTTMANALYSPELYVNGEIKLNLKVSENNLLTLAAGETTLTIAPDKKYSGKTSLTLPLANNKLYYIRVDTSLKINDSSSYETYQRSFNLTLVDEARAKKEISQCCAHRTESDKEKTSTETKEVEPEVSDGFSVDKTQNPFSH